MEFGGAHSMAQSRARALNKKSHKKSEEQMQSTKRALLERLNKQYGENFNELKTQNMGTLWREFVKDRNDAEAFMEIMYPQFLKPVQLAYAHMFERAVRGEIQLDKDFLFDKKKQEERVWDPLKDIEKERQVGLTNVASKKLDELIIEHEQRQELIKGK